jgi:hypothetical protein
MKNGAEGVIVDDIEDEQIVAEKATNGNKNHLRAWWQPIIDQLKLDDPEQEPAFWLATNNLVLNTPFPGIQIKAYAMTNGSRIGLFLSGPRRDNVLMLKKYLKRERAALLAELPKGTEIDTGDCSVYIYVDGPDSDHEKRAWIMKTMNAFVNVLRPRLKKWYTESRA